MKINIRYAHRALAIIGGTGDVDNTRPELEFWNDVPDLNDRVHGIVSKYVVPYLQAWDDETRLQAKQAIAYLLTFTPERAKSIFDSSVASFHEPEPAHLLFEWLWDEVFPGESWNLTGSASDYEVVEDLNARHPKFNPIVRVPSPYTDKEFMDFQPTVPPR